MLSDGPVPLRLHGANGPWAAIDRSDNLVDWDDWQMMTLGGDGCGLIDTTTETPHRFYRVMEDAPTSTAEP